MKRALVAVVVLVSGAAVAGVFSGGGGAMVNVLAELVGENVNAASYTATSTTGPSFVSTGDRVDAARLGTHPRATIGPCEPGAPDICVGPNDFGYTSKFRTWGDIIAQGFQVRDNIDVLGNAAIVNNSGPVRITDTDGLVVNATTALKGRVAVPVTFDSASINNGTCLDQAVTVAGAVVDDFVTSAYAAFTLPPGVSVDNAFVTATNTVELRLCNVDPSTPRDPASGLYKFVLER